MTTESKPPMRQIAELIDGIATARAESAERLLGECETQLIETRAHLGDMVGQLGHREAEIARLEEYADAANETAGNAIREVIDLRRANAQLDATIARLKAELAAALAANQTAPTTAVEVPRPATATEIRTYMDKLAGQPRTGGYVPPPAPPAESHRAWPPAAEIAKWVDDWHAGKIPTPIEPAPPAADPRVDALCRVVVTMANMHWPKEWGLSLSPLLHADLETIGARR